MYVEDKSVYVGKEGVSHARGSERVLDRTCGRWLRRIVSTNCRGMCMKCYFDVYLVYSLRLKYLCSNRPGFEN